MYVIKLDINKDIFKINKFFKTRASSSKTPTSAGLERSFICPLPLIYFIEKALNSQTLGDNEQHPLSQIFVYDKPNDHQFKRPKSPHLV